MQLLKVAVTKNIATAASGPFNHGVVTTETVDAIVVSTFFSAMISPVYSLKKGSP